MKRFLGILLAVALVIGCIPSMPAKASEVAADGSIDRSKWTGIAFDVNSREEYTESHDVDGPVKNMIDDSVETLYHTDYNKGTATLPLYIFIDLGELTYFSSFSWQNRDKNGAKVIEFYVNESATSLIPADTTEGGYTGGVTNWTKVAQINKLNSGGVTYKDLDRHVVAKEIMIKVTEAYNQNSDGTAHVTCKDFKLYEDYTARPKGALNRNNWTGYAFDVNSREEHPQSTTDGPISYMLDNNVNTLFHTNYNNNNNTTLPVYVFLDLDEKTTFSAFTWHNRADNAATEYEFYINTSDTDLMTGFASKTDGIDSLSAGWEKICSSKDKGNLVPDKVNEVDLGQRVTAKQIAFKITAQNTTYNHYVTCRDFNLYDKYDKSIDMALLKVEKPTIGGSLADVTYGDYVAAGVKDTAKSPATLTTSNLAVVKDGEYNAISGRITALNTGTNNAKFNVTRQTKFLLRFNVKVPNNSNGQTILGKTDDQYGIQMNGNNSLSVFLHPANSQKWAETNASGVTLNAWHDVIAAYTYETGLVLFVDDIQGTQNSGDSRPTNNYELGEYNNCNFSIGYNNSKYNNSKNGYDFQGKVANVVMYTGDQVPDITNGITAEQLRTGLAGKEPMFRLDAVAEEGIRPNYTITSTTWTGSDGEVISDLDITGVNTVTATLTPETGYAFTKTPNVIKVGEDYAFVDSAKINDDGTMTVSYQFDGNAIYNEFKESTSTFLGGSLRKTYVDGEGNITNQDDYTNGTKTSIRFGYELNPIEGYTLKSWSWNWGLAQDKLSGYVPGNNSLPAEEEGKAGVLISNLVIQNVPKDYYDDPIYSKLVMVYENDETGNEVVIDTDVVNKNIVDISKKAVENPIRQGDDVYAQKLLFAIGQPLNIACFATANTENTIASGHDVANVNDGDESTDFQSEGNWPTEVVLTWEENRSFSEVMVKIGGADGEQQTRSVDVVVEYLQDGSGEFREFGSGTSPVYANKQFSVDESITASKIRVTLKNPQDTQNPNPTFWPSIKEIEVY